MYGLIVWVDSCYTLFLIGAFSIARKLIMEYPTDSSRKVVSQFELARHLGLSEWTVSRAINGHPAVKESTRRRVMQVMREVGYQPSPLALGLRGKKTGLVGISFTGVLRDSVLLEKLDLFQTFLRTRHLRGIVSFNERSETSQLQAIADFRSLHVDAILLVQSSLPARLCEEMLKGLVAVHVDPTVEQEGPVVSLDRDRGMELLVNHLVEFGHRHFGTLGIKSMNSWRWPGLVKALARHGLDPGQVLKSYGPRENQVLSYQMGVELAERVLADPKAPTALIAISDRLAMGAAQHLVRRGATVPGRFSITGFDHLEVADHLHPKLTTIDHQAEKLVETAGKLLLTLLNEEEAPNIGPPIKTPPRLIVGHSTGPACPLEKKS